ncbi:MAG: patatin-like phospholipase family protein [Methylococcales bacterium]
MTQDTLRSETAELAECRPDLSQSPDPGTFELGIVLAGAVSAGAYTAGVIDFLVEALDNFAAAQKQERAKFGDDYTRWTVPPHKVKLKVITGASAGAITGAIVAAALRYPFPHIRRGQIESLPSDAASGNPLFDSWVSDIDIRYLLQTGDLAGNGGTPPAVMSLLDSSRLDDIRSKAIAFSLDREIERPWVTDPMRVILTVANLRGVPYRERFEGTMAIDYEMSAHSDQMRFALTGLGEGPRGAVCPDEFRISFPKGDTGRDGADNAWYTLGLAAVASAAFPVGLAPRALSRPRAQYDYRRVLVPGDGKEEPALASILPAWSEQTLREAQYDFVCVDGGTMDNEPLELARVELAGPLGRNPRDGAKAVRATILVDPFPNMADTERRGPENYDIVNSLFGLLGAWKEQARFKPEDVALAKMDSVYSRFAITPSGGGSDGTKVGATAIASGALDGFSGFLSVDYRCHDFLLGRKNCQDFLRQAFSLPKGNGAVFVKWSDELKNSKDPNLANGDELLIIPLYGSSRDDERALPWPRNRFDPASITGAVDRRLDAVFDSINANYLSNPEGKQNLIASVVVPIRRFLIGFGWRVLLKRKAMNYLIGKITDSLRSQELI